MSMTDKEVQEITKILEDAGWEPQLCDTPIPVYESVHAPISNPSPHLSVSEASIKFTVL